MRTCSASSHSAPRRVFKGRCSWSTATAVRSQPRRDDISRSRPRPTSTSSGKGRRGTCSTTTIPRSSIARRSTSQTGSHVICTRRVEAHDEATLPIRGNEPRADTGSRRRGSTLTTPAFTELTEPYRRQLHVHCYRMLGSFADADDLVQETLLRAWRGRAGFRGGALVRTWLYRIAPNACLTALQRRQRRILPSDVA